MQSLRPTCRTMSTLQLAIIAALLKVAPILLDYLNQLHLNTASPDRFIPDVTRFAPEYDFVVVGAGSAGSALSARLAEDPRWSVLLLEAGKDETFLTDVPLMASRLSNSEYAWRYRAERDDRSCRGMRGSACRVPKGKALGGSSVVNFMIYVRGSVSDFDRWRDLGNPGWGYDDVLPYFIKSENASVAGPERGHDGHLSVQHARWRSPLAACFLEAGAEAGLEEVDVSARVRPGVSLVQGTLADGERCSASRAYLRPARMRPNLYVAQQARVTRVLIDEASRRAYGVEFVKDGVVHAVRARKEVILSAGVINSPQLLMLSGVGPREHLEGLGIPVVSDLRVGGNLQDHVFMLGLVFLLNDSVSFVEKRALFDPRTVLDYVADRRGVFTLPGGAEGVAFVNTRFTADHEDPDIELLSFVGAPIGAFAERIVQGVTGLSRSLSDRLFAPLRGRDAFSIMPILMRPRSRGRVMLRSADPKDAPKIFLNYFDDERDLDVLVEGVKKAVAFGESRAFQKFQSRLLPVPFPGCEALPFRSDEYWRCCARLMTGTIQHQTGTCKMAPASDPDGVVDAELRVRGVLRLRVVDASIMPELPSAHTNAVAIMIGEKAADMIKKAWA